MKKSTGFALIIALFVVGAAIVFWQYQQANKQDATEASLLDAPPIATPQPILRHEPVAIEPLVAEVHEPEQPDPNADLLVPPAVLDDSDGDVQALAELLAPSFKQWLLPEQQIRKWVAAVDMMAEGAYPRKYPPLDFPLAKFKVEKVNGQLQGAAINNRRADVLISALTAIEPGLLARYYKFWLPVLNKAYSELGRSELFSERLMLSLDAIIGLELAPLNAALEQPHVFYRYQDEALEKRSDLDKLVWRLGRNNQLALQQFLKAFKQQL